jgi:hypothetical protein
METIYVTGRWSIMSKSVKKQGMRNKETDAATIKIDGVDLTLRIN